MNRVGFILTFDVWLALALIVQVMGEEVEPPIPSATLSKDAIAKVLAGLDLPDDKIAEAYRYAAKKTYWQRLTMTCFPGIGQFVQMEWTLVLATAIPRLTGINCRMHYCGWGS